MYNWKFIIILLNDNGNIMLPQEHLEFISMYSTVPTTQLTINLGAKHSYL